MLSKNKKTAYEKQIFLLSSDEREKLLKNVINIVSENENIDNVKTQIVNLIGKVFKADRCFIRIFNQNLDDFNLVDNYSEYLSSSNIISLVGLKFEELFNRYGIEKYKQGVCFCIPDVKIFCEQHPELPFLKILCATFKVKSNYCCPISQNNKLVGAFVVHYVNKFVEMGEEEKDILKIIAKQVIMAIQKSQFREQIILQNKREILMRNILEKVRKSLDANEIKKNIVNEIGKTFGADRVFIAEYDNKINKYLLIDKNAEYLSNPKLKSISGVDFNEIPGFDIISNLHKNQKEIIYSDVDEFLEKNDAENKKNEFFYKFNRKASAAFLIMHGNKFMGNLVIHYLDKKIFTEDDLNLLRTIANQAGIALYQAELYEKERTALKYERVLTQIIDKTKNVVNLDESLFMISNIIEKHYKTSKFFIMGFNQQQKSTNIYREGSYINNKKCFSLKKENIINKYFYKIFTQNPNFIIFNNIYNNNLPKKVQKELEYCDIKSFIFVSKKINKQEKIGTAIFIDKQNFWNETDINFLARVVDHVDYLIKNSKLYNQINFSANVSHELKTPIAIIKGYAEALLKRQNSDKKVSSDFLNIIIKNVDRIDEIINNLLYLTNLENYSENKGIDFKHTSIIKLIDETIENCKNQAAEKNIEILNISNSDIQANINVPLLQQALINLITNSIKYSNSNTFVKVDAKIKNEEIIISVADEGCGIDKNELSKIFEPFYRIDTSRSRETGGSGLGLSITRLICEMHGGSISVISEKQKGSTFEIHIPILF